MYEQEEHRLPVWLLVKTTMVTSSEVYPEAKMTPRAKVQKAFRDCR